MQKKFKSRREFDQEREGVKGDLEATRMKISLGITTILSVFVIFNALYVKAEFHERCPILLILVLILLPLGVFLYSQFNKHTARWKELKGLYDQIDNEVYIK